MSATPLGSPSGGVLDKYQPLASPWGEVSAERSKADRRGMGYIFYAAL